MSKGNQRLRELLESVNELRFHRRDWGPPEGAQPVDPENPDCKWYIEQRHRGERPRALPPLARRSQDALLSALLRGQLRTVPGLKPGTVVLRPVMRLTDLHKRPTIREAWREYLPCTTDAVRQLNRSVSKLLHVPRSSWTTETLGRSGVVGTAYDYAVGSIWAGDNLAGVFARVRSATIRFPVVRSVFSALQRMLDTELAVVRRGQRPLSLEYFRGLILLAELDAMSRAPVDPPRWLPRIDPEAITEAELRAQLGKNYPEEAAAELSDLLKVTLECMGVGDSLVYNPVFGGPPGLEHIGADGDVIVGSTLFELKASIRPYTYERLWQLLGYACLDRLHGRDRIRRVAFFNPRRRHLWSVDLDQFVVSMGGGSFASFVQWFRQTPAANGLDLIVG
jgi:hypothetical protein